MRIAEIVKFHLLNLKNCLIQFILFYSFCFYTNIFNVYRILYTLFKMYMLNNVNAECKQTSVKTEHMQSNIRRIVIGSPILGQIDTLNSLSDWQSKLCMSINVTVFGVNFGEFIVVKCPLTQTRANPHSCCRCRKF